MSGLSDLEIRSCALMPAVHLMYSILSRHEKKRKLIKKKPLTMEQEFVGTNSVLCV